MPVKSQVARGFLERPSLEWPGGRPLTCQRVVFDPTLVLGSFLRMPSGRSMLAAGPFRGSAEGGGGGDTNTKFTRE